MDRFIGGPALLISFAGFYLKSNMDRFIGGPALLISFAGFYLKSNMDRFIVDSSYIDYAK